MSKTDCIHKVIEVRKSKESHVPFGTRGNLNKAIEKELGTRELKPRCKLRGTNNKLKCDNKLSTELGTTYLPTSECRRLYPIN